MKSLIRAQNAQNHQKSTKTEGPNGLPPSPSETNFPQKLRRIPFRTLRTPTDSKTPVGVGTCRPNACAPKARASTLRSSRSSGRSSPCAARPMRFPSACTSSAGTFVKNPRVTDGLRSRPRGAGSNAAGHTRNPAMSTSTRRSAPVAVERNPRSHRAERHAHHNVVRAELRVSWTSATKSASSVESVRLQPSYPERTRRS